MSENHKLAVDPYLLCFQTPCESADQINGFIDRLLGWSSLSRNKDMHVLVSDKTRIALIDDGDYPEQHNLRAAMRAFNYDAADPETVCRVLQNILDTTPSLEEYLGVEDVLIDETKTKINPNFLCDRLTGKKKRAFIEMLAILSLFRVVIDPENIKAMYVTSATRQDNFCENLDVTVEIELHDCSIVNGKLSQPLPIGLQDQIPFMWSYNGLMQHLGICAIWQEADSAEYAIEAIELSIRELASSGLDESGRRAYRLGNYFLESAKQWGFFNRTDYAMLLVESCARIVLDAPKNPIKPFRVSSTSSEQRVRSDDGALAFRTHLSKSGVGFRLMLWQLPDDTIEFANVGDKDELIIL
ncbi:hypothetical protein [Sporomusa ovata]|nr:hypothetical protein [Sporomusa ovata]